MFNPFKKKEIIKELKAVTNGTVFPITEVKDDVFSSCMLGHGFAIRPSDGMVVAPIDGEISVVMDGSNHAVGIKVAEGFDLLIHIGIDTVSLNGEGFTPFVTMGQKVKAGDKLIQFDKDLVESKGFCSDVIVISLDNPELPKISYTTGVTAVAGETVVATW